MKFLRTALCGALSLFVVAPSAQAKDLKVVASIKPVHSLVASVLGDTAKAEVLVDGSSSPHGFRLKPSQAKSLSEADLVVWMGPGLETFLIKPLETIAKDARNLELSEVPGMKLLEMRGEHHHHDHGEEEHHDDHAKHDDHDHEEKHAHHDDHDDHDDHKKEDHDEGHHDEDHDLHIWLNPQNAIAMTRQIAVVLSEINPEHKPVYQQNAKALVQRLSALDAEITRMIAPLKNRNIVVFHDAYHYFEDQYGLKMVAALTANPEVNPGAKRVHEIQDILRDKGAGCIFAEAQFSDRLVDTVTEGTSVKKAKLDPLGAHLEASAGLYEALLRETATSVTNCLSR